MTSNFIQINLVELFQIGAVKIADAAFPQNIKARLVEIEAV
jgi:hypothetical protein